MNNLLYPLLRRYLRPLAHKAIGNIVKAGLAFLAVWLASKGYLSDGDKTDFLLNVTPVVIAMALQFWDDHEAQILALTMGALPKGSTLNDGYRVIAAGNAPPASLKANERPLLETEWQATQGLRLLSDD